MVLIKSPLKPRHFWVLGGVVELISGRDVVARTARIKQGGTVKLQSLRQLFLLKLSLLADEDEVVPLPSSAGAAAVPLHPSPSDEGEVFWLCPICNVPRYDGCDSWCHFRFVEVESFQNPTLVREKWYCPDCTPLGQCRGRPSSLPE